MTRTIRSIHVTIPTENGWQLAGTVDLPRDLKLEDAPRRAVVAHCFTCTRGAIGVTRISKALARAGYASLRFDFAGLGDSGGKFEETTLGTNVSDVQAAAKWFGGAELLVGHSLGGTAVQRAAAEVASVESIVTVGTPFELQETAKRAPEIMQMFERQRELSLGQALLDELAAADSADTVAAVSSSDATSLVLHSPDDLVVPVAEAHAMRAALPRADWVSLAGMDHLLLQRGSGQRVGEMIAAWEGLRLK